MKRCIVTLQGRSPILVNAFGDHQEIDLPGAAGRSGTRTVVLAKEPTPREVATKAAYRNKRGEFYLPSTCILALCCAMGALRKIRGSRRSLKYLIPAALEMPTEEIVILNGDGKTPAKDFEVDSRPVVIPSTKGRVMRHRPRFDTWSMVIPLDIDEELIEPAEIHRLIEDGGRRNGLGDYRPEKMGPFGRYRVLCFEEENTPAPKRRGRPPKDAPAAGPEENAPERKRRGRPRKDAAEV